MEQERRLEEKPKKKKYRKERMKRQTADEKKSFYFQKIQFSLILRNDQNYCQHWLCVTGDMCLVSQTSNYKIRAAETLTTLNAIFTDLNEKLEHFALARNDFVQKFD